MGIDLGEIIQKKKITLDELSGKVLAIDAYNALYQFLAVIRGESGEPLMDSNHRITSHLSGLFYRSIKLLEKGIKLVYVFDGKPPLLKEVEINNRRSKKREAAIKYDEALKAGKLPEARRYAQATSQLKDMMVDDAKRLLTSMGIAWIEAPSEGEAQAAHMSCSESVWGVVSQDYDSLLFGARRLVRNLNLSGRRKLPGRETYIEIEPEQIDLDELLQGLQITRAQLVDIGILIGTDFNPDGFKGIGPVKALRLIKQYKKLEEIQAIQLAKINYKEIRDIFLKPKVSDEVDLKWKNPDTKAIVDFLCHQRDFSETRVKTALARLEEIRKKKSETLERWFS